MENKITSFKLFILYKNCFSTSVQVFFCSCYCKLQSFVKHQSTKNTLQIALRQQTELPHPLLRRSSSKITTFVREQRYTRIKYTCKVVHLQKIKSFGRGARISPYGVPLFFTLHSETWKKQLNVWEKREHLFNRCMSICDKITFFHFTKIRFRENNLLISYV